MALADIIDTYSKLYRIANNPTRPKQEPTPGVTLELSGLGQKVDEDTFVMYRKGDPEFDSYVEAWEKVREPGLPGNMLTCASYPDGTWMWKKLDNVYSQYYHGTVDEKEIEDTLSDMVSYLRSAYADAGFDPDEFMPKLIEDVNSSAQLSNMRNVEIRSHEDGLAFKDAFVDPRDQYHSSYVYYDAKYYYQSEDMKTFTKNALEKIGQRFGVEGLDLPRCPQNSYYYNYNSMINEKLRFRSTIGNVIDENMAPPEDFRFFYRSSDCCNNVYPAGLKTNGDPEASTDDGILQIWCGDWTFLGRVPVRQNAVLYPASVNMYDVVSRSAQTIPSELIPFLQNFDFFAICRGLEYTSAHPRIYG